MKRWVGIIGILAWLGLGFGARDCFASASDTAAGAQRPGTLEEQKKLAQRLYEEMTQADEWNLDLFITNHRRVIDECPDTPLAAESCWRLSNLYLTGKGKKNLPEVIRLMEHLLNKYPECSIREMAISRLVNTCQEAGEHQKILDFCEVQLKGKGLTEAGFLSYSLWAGEALESLGQAESAAKYYQNVLQKDPEKTTMLAQAAQMRLNRLSKLDDSKPAGK